VQNSRKVLVQGVGINDADYPVNPRVDGKVVVCPYYRAWASLLARCYSEAVHKAQPTYVGCSVIEEWLRFSTFRGWMETQIWRGLNLDKDIIVPGNMIYGPDTCAFVPGYVNVFFNSHSLREKTLPLGVSYMKKTPDMINEMNKPYAARLREYGKCKLLGRYSDPLDAHKAWQIGKVESIKNLMQRYKEDENFNIKVYSGLEVRISILERAINSSEVTKCL